ncbi:hypothetical protein [Methylorubrum extorquens]|uniref:Uncharacterized protein n=1 Tax=Methylorubrum extorquens TaxID=408 RepID=A0AAX3WI01_METEX|nr:MULTISPECIES: hypothetical protein [Methylobacteriaceae]WHQ71199.1 hypothetical protein KEC54_06395 [Methylorubrum extorquens]
MIGKPIRHARRRGGTGLPCHDRVDDELGDIENQGRDGRAGKAQTDTGEHQGAARRPGKVEKGREVPERTDPCRGCAAKPGGG